MSENKYIETTRIKGAESPWCTFKNNVQRELAEREEKSFVSLLLKNKEFISDAISEGIKYSHFWWNDTSEFYKIISRYFDQYKAILTREQFRNEIERLYKDSESQTYYRNKYDEIINLGISDEDFLALKKNIQNRTLLHQSYNAIQNHFSNILEAKGDYSKEIESFIQDVIEIKGSNHDGYSKTISLSQSMDEVWKQIEDRKLHPENYYGLMSGFKCLDKKFHGFLRGKYLVFTGMPNGGKTSVMFNVAMNIAMGKHHVVYVTIESEHIRATQRVLCIYSGIDENRILRGGSGSEGLNEETMEILSKAKEELINMENFSWIQVVQGTPATKILEMVERKRAFSDVDVLVIDYLDIVGKDKSFPTRPDLELADVSATFQAYGKKTNTLVITAQQLKASMVSKIQKAKDTFSAFDAGVGDVSGSQKIVADADYVLSVAIDQKTKDRIYLRSSKARFNRSLDVYTLSFDMNSGKCSDMPSVEGFEQLSKMLEDEETKKLKIQEAKEDKTLLDGIKNEDDSGFGDILPTDNNGGDEWLTGGN